MDYRISHYNELNKKTQWTSVSDIIDENNLEETFSLYKRTEDKYINIFKKLLKENDIIKMGIYALERHRNKGIYKTILDKALLKRLKLKNGNTYLLEDTLEILKFCLREVIWCKFEWENIYIHIGYDYYAYIGGLEITRKCIEEEFRKGITIEEFKSPYL